MKKKAYLAALAMCMMLVVNGCGTKETTDEGNNIKTEQTDSKKESKSGDTRLVSVENVEKYITIADYKGIVLDNTVAEVTDTQVDANISSVLQGKSETVTAADGVVENGDTATINFVGMRDGEAFEGGTANNYDLVIGSGSMIPGFEEGIVGMKKGETKDVTVTFPESYRNTELAGQEAVFQITVQSFKRAPELTDEWVAANTDHKTIDEYKAAVRAELEEAAQEQAENSLRSTAWMTVYSNSEVQEYPEEDIEEASKSFRSLAETYAAQAEMELEDFIESQGISMEDFEAQCEQYAQAKVKQDLIIQGIMDAEGMTLEDEECLAIQEKLVEQYAAGNLATLIDTYGQVAVDESIGLMRVEEFIVANAKYDQASDAADEETQGEETESETQDETQEGEE